MKASEQIRHTEEPWITSGNGIDICASEVVSKADASSRVCVATTLNQVEGWDYEHMQANARRIVACVNACAGISTEELEEQVSHGKLIKLTECNSCRDLTSY